MDEWFMSAEGISEFGSNRYVIARKFDNTDPDRLHLAYKEVMGTDPPEGFGTDSFTGVKMKTDQFKAFMERMGVRDFDPFHIEGKHCFECLKEECYPDGNFEIVMDMWECDCRKCH